MPPWRKRARDGTRRSAPPPAGIVETLIRMDVEAVAEFIPREIGWKAVYEDLIRGAKWVHTWLLELGHPKQRQLLYALVRRGDTAGAATIAETTVVSSDESRCVWDAFCESHPPGMCTALWGLLPHYTPVNTCERGTHILSPVFPCCGKVFPEYVAKEAIKLVLSADPMGDFGIHQDFLVLYATHGRFDLAAQLHARHCHVRHAMYPICKAGCCDGYYEHVVRPLVERQLCTRAQSSCPSERVIESVICGHVRNSFARLQAHGLLKNHAGVGTALRCVWSLDLQRDAELCTLMQLIYMAHKEPLIAFLSSGDTHFLMGAIVLFHEWGTVELVKLLADVLPVKDIPEAIVGLVDAFSM